MAAVLAAHNVSFVFTLTGGHISPILTACDALRPIRVIDVRHEATAVFAADAVARLTGELGVAAVTAGPGVTNTLTALQNANMAHSPVLLLCGATATLMRQRGALQDINQMALLRPACKRCYSVRRVTDIVPTLRNAIRTARSDTPGPVCVQLPIDVLYPYELVMREMGLEDKGTMKRKRSNWSSLMGMVTRWYLRLYVNDLFAGAWLVSSLQPLPIRKPLTRSSKVQTAARILQKSSRPLAVVGSSAVAPGGEIRAARLAASLQRLGVPCYLAGGARGLFGAARSPIVGPRLQLFHERRRALREADCVLLLGVPADFRLGYGRALPPARPVVSVHTCRRQVRLNAGTFWTPTVAACGDVVDFVERLVDTLSDSRRGEIHQRHATGSSLVLVDDQWWRELYERDEAAEQRITVLSDSISSPATQSACSATLPSVNPLMLLRQLDLQLPEDSILIMDGGDFVGSAAYILRPRAPACWLDPGVFGTLGCGAGFALAAGLVRPGATVWLVYGDGACGFSLLELDSLRRHRVAVAILVGNDACWTQIAREQTAIFHSDVACRLEHTRYDQVAEALGARGYHLTEPHQICSCLQAASRDVIAGRSVLINAHISATKFRDGSVSV